jgi:tRNA (cmo5U34)-methyltransferase
MSQKDTLFSNQITEPGDFVFDKHVVSVFPDMINRSIPGYALIIPMIGLLARRYAQQDSRIYDLGCSLGAATLAMRQAIEVRGVEIIAVDNSEEMIDGLKDILAQQGGGINVQAVVEDIRSLAIRDASVVVLNFTLQFINPVDRLRLMRSIVGGLRPGGILILSEKLCFEDALEQERQTTWHHDFKRAQGYSELEISRKRDALENILKPETARVHRERLSEAGFSEVYQWFQGFSFVSFVAIR